MATTVGKNMLRSQRDKLLDSGLSEEHRMQLCALPVSDDLRDFHTVVIDWFNARESIIPRRVWLAARNAALGFDRPTN